jgi:hypothetical protein
MRRSVTKRTVEAEEFILRDADGKVRARLASLPDGTHLDLYDGGGTRRASLGVTATGVGLAFYDPDGKPQATLGSGPAGVAVRQSGPSGELQDFSCEAQAAPILVFYGSNKMPQVLLSVVSGRPHLKLSDATGNIIHSVPQE